VQISSTQWTYVGLALVGAAVQGFTLRIMRNRKMLSDFPVFFRYSAFCATASVVSVLAYIFYCSSDLYFYGYWVITTGTMVLEFAVLYELLVNALKPYAALIDLGKMLFRWAAVFLILAALLTAFATAGSGNSKVVAAIDLLQRTVRLMQCGLLLLFFGLEKRLGLSWRTHSMAIALGLGVYAGVDLSTSYLVDRVPAMANALHILNNVVYLGASALWAYSLAKAEPARSNVLDSPSRLIFQRWNEALTSYSIRGEVAFASSGVESFLPGVEQTVERVLARKIIQ
jgi:hypothetical protein